jgi:branched-chain amino acid aminotransferase
MIWVNGSPYPFEGPHVSARDRGVTLADGVFETMRARSGTIFQLNRHLARLGHGLATLSIPEPTAVRSWILDAVSATRGDASVRVTVTRGVGGGGLVPTPDADPTVIVIVNELPRFPRRIYEEGLSAHVASGRRNQHAMTNGLKTLAYTDAIMALLEARRAGADEALFLDTDGHCSEATASNLFIWTGDVLMTPPVSCGALPGITRAVVLDLAAALGVKTEVDTCELDTLGTAAEAFLTSSLRGLAPLVRIGGRPIGRGSPGTLTRQLSAAYTALVAQQCGAPT